MSTRVERCKKGLELLSFVTKKHFEYHRYKIDFEILKWRESAGKIKIFAWRERWAGIEEGREAVRSIFGGGLGSGVLGLRGTGLRGTGWLCNLAGWLAGLAGNKHWSEAREGGTRHPSTLYACHVALPQNSLPLPRCFIAHRISLLFLLARPRFPISNPPRRNVKPACLINYETYVFFSTSTRSATFRACLPFHPHGNLWNLTEEIIATDNQ